MPGTDVLDSTHNLVLSTGLCLIQRDATTIQIGLEPPRRILVHRAPPGTIELLESLNGERSTTALINRMAQLHQIEVDSWSPILTELLGLGFLTTTGEATTAVDGAESSGAQPERIALASTLGPVRAATAMRQRREAVIVIIGCGRVADSIGAVLATAGVGHVHIDPHRALRPTDVAPAGLPWLDLFAGHSAGSEVRSDPEPRSVRRRGRPRLPDPGHAHSADLPRPFDRDAVAAVVRRVSPDVLVHPPAGYLPPSLVVLATDGPADQATARDLISRRVPHLSVRASEVSGVVGPLVLPGRSSCLYCADLYRTDADPGWPKVALAMHRTTAVPPAVLATALAAAAGAQVLQFLDGQTMPAAVDGTLILKVSDWVVRRRSWSPHPACYCRGYPPRRTARDQSTRSDLD